MSNQYDQNGSCRRTPSQVDSGAHALPRSGTRVNMFLRMHVTTFQAKQAGNMTTKDLEEAARMLRPNSSRRGGKQGKHAQSGVRAHARTDVWAYIDAPDVPVVEAWYVPARPSPVRCPCQESPPTRRSHTPGPQPRRLQVAPFSCDDSLTPWM